MMREITIILAAALAASVSAPARAAESWGNSHASWAPVARQCLAKLTAGVECASCFAFWPEIAKCVAAQTAPDVSPAAIDRCIHQVNDRDYSLPQSHDRVADTMACLSR
jgi:hypothetical protein